jgi:hypothetical protein
MYNNKKQLLKKNFNDYFKELIKSIEKEYEIDINSKEMFFSINKDFEKSMEKTESETKLHQNFNSEQKSENHITETVVETIETQNDKKSEMTTIEKPKIEQKQLKADSETTSKISKNDELELKTEKVELCEDVVKKFSATCICFNKKKKMYCGRPTKVGDYCGYHKDMATN